MSPFVKGLVIGFSIAAPVGPIGLLCIRRALADGRLAGFVSGLGAATADAMYGGIAALGLTVVTSRLIEYRPWLQAGGGGFMLYLGLSALRTRPPANAAGANSSATLAGAYGSTFILTLANPMTILSFIGIFAALDTGRVGGGPLVLGVFFGSAAWWFLLSTIAGWCGRRLQQGRGLRAVDIGAGLIIAGFGAWQLVQLV